MPIRLLLLLLFAAAPPIAGRCATAQTAPGDAATAREAPDSVLTGFEEVARFADARDLAADPFGVLYVADGAHDVVYGLGPEGQPLFTLGGPGSRPGEFDGPAGVDPTNGLALLVADEGNGRIQRFSKAGAHLGSLELPGTRTGAGRALGSPSAGELFGDEGGAGGAPVAVASTGRGDVYALDAARGAVIHWNGTGRLAAEIGGLEAGAGALVEPVAMALDPKRALYVADRGIGAVRVYDLFGGYMRRLGEGRLQDVRALFTHEGSLWVVLPNRLEIFDAEGRLVRTFATDVREPLVDGVWTEQGLYLLTGSRLYRLRTR